MKEWLKDLDTTDFEENLKRVGFSSHEVNVIKARVETYLLPQIDDSRLLKEVAEFGGNKSAQFDQALFNYESNCKVSIEGAKEIFRQWFLKQIT